MNDWELENNPESGPLPETIISPKDGAEMVLVPEGEFIMGISEKALGKVFFLDERQTPVFLTETPARTLCLPPYYIDRYPVTNFQYQKFVEETGRKKPSLWGDPLWNQPMQPVVFVGWDDARAYARWTEKSLPNEAQWEKAGRGVDGRLWSWGNEFLPGRCNSREYGLGHASEIGLFHEGISPFGCYDMCGNVWEICEGRWQGELLPMRGGCFLGTATFVRVTCRWTPEDPVNGAHWLGFRCVKNVLPKSMRAV